MWRRKCPPHMIIVQIIKQNQKMALYSVVPSKQMGFPGDFSGKEPACQCKRVGFDPWVRKIPWRRKWQPTPVFLPGKSH